MKRDSFAEYYAKVSPMPFYVMMGLFAFTNMLIIINFTDQAREIVLSARTYINAGLLWLCPMYFALQLLLWKIRPATCAIAVGLIAGVFGLWNVIGMTNEIFCAVVATFLALMAYKRDYRKILLIFLCAHLMTVLVGILGLGIGYTAQQVKPENIEPGISMGLIYPNHLGRMMYMVLTLTWYLWGQKKHLLTVAVFWIASFVSFYFVKCLTAAFLLALFPVCWLATQWLLKHPAPAVLHKIWNILMICLPLICFLATYALGTQRVWFYTVTKGTRFYTMAMRFIAAGILFNTFHFPLLGRNIYDTSAPSEIINGEMYTASVVDNTYVFYMILFGMVLLMVCLIWLGVANWKCIRNGDHALLLIAVFMLGYGMMEIITLQFEHNFMWFYPLAAAAAVPMRIETGTIEKKPEEHEVIDSEEEIHGDL